MTNLQLYYDITKAHIIAQGEPAAILDPARGPDGISCQYLTDTGLRCAVGCHIPVSVLLEAAPDENGLGLTDVLDLIGTEVADTITFFGDLQAAHDGALPRSFDEMDVERATKAMAKIGFVTGNPLDESRDGVWVTNTLQRLAAVAKLHGLTA